MKLPCLYAFASDSFHSTLCLRGLIHFATDWHFPMNFATNHTFM